MNFCLISYDVTDDTRRTRIHDLLRNHGVRVQKSVFECILPEKKLQELQERLSRMIHPTVDSIRFYRMCRRCLTSVEVLGVGTEPDMDNQLPVII